MDRIPTCPVCSSTKISGPYIGDMQGEGIRFQLFQCHGDFRGRRCENTRAVKVEAVTVDELREKGAI